MVPTLRGYFSTGLVIAVLAINAVAIATVYFGLRQLHDRDIREAEIRSQNLARALEQSVSHEIGRIDLSLATVTSNLASHRLRPGQPVGHSIDALIKQQNALLDESDGWTITDAAGAIVYHHGAPWRPGTVVMDRDYFTKLKNGMAAGLVVSPPLLNRLTGQNVIMLARAYRDEAGNFAGIVAVPLPLSYLAGLLSGFEVGKNGILTLRDANLGVIARVPAVVDRRPLPLGDTRVSADLRHLVNSGARLATYEATNVIDGIERIHSYRRLENAPIYALAGISKADFLADWNRLRWLSLGLLVLFLLVTNLSAVFLCRQWQLQRHYSAALGKSNARIRESLRTLSERDSALLAAQEAGDLGTYRIDLATGDWSASEKQATLFGIDASYPRTLAGWHALIHEADRQPFADCLQNEILARHQALDREYRVVRPCDGRTIWVHGLGKLEFDASGKPMCISGTTQDISDRKFAEERLHLANEVFESASEGIMVTDSNGVIIEINPAFAQITGYGHDEAVGRTPRLLKSNVQDAAFYRSFWQSLRQNGEWEGELINRRRDGSLYTQHSRISAVRDAQGVITRFTTLFSDITQFRESLRQVEHLAYHDKLTGLPNRALFADRMQNAIARCRRRNELLGVCYLDLDGFKPVNDSWGHEVGDQLLIEVAKRLAGCTRAGDTVARLGGDEFVVLCGELKDESDVELAVSRMLQAVAEPYHLGEIRVALTISVGVTIFPNDAADDPDTLMRHADQAMYEAKRNGKNRMHFFDPESDRRMREHQTQYARIIQALAENEFRLHYQPKVDLRDGSVSGLEALIRWQHPEHGLVTPDRFLSVVETTELTLPIGEWVLHEALQQQRRWQDAGINVSLSVNVFAKHLQRADFVERLKAILDAYPEVVPGGLELEILETTAMEDLAEITKRIGECTRLGVRVSLDDFGTGYSSLTYFRQLPVDLVKIDRSFVRDILADENARVLVQGIINMAHALQRKVVAEGVETLEHGIALRHCGCDFAQGYGIARPMPPEALEAWLKQWQMPDSWRQALAESAPKRVDVPDSGESINRPDA